jgi:hypothetical protein
MNDSTVVCNMAVPSGSSSGIKLHFSSAVQTQAGMDYLLRFSFVYDHDVVNQGNGGCLLHPEYSTSVKGI